MTELHSMPMFWAEFFADTEHMSDDAAHAYLFLIGHAWLRKAKLANDDRALARMARVSFKKWKAIKPEVLSLWVLDEADGGWWSQKRLTKEWLFVSRRAEDNRKNGSLGGTRSAAKRQINSTKPSKQPVNHPTPTPTIEELSNDSSIAEASPPQRAMREKKPPPPNPIITALGCLSPETAQAVIEHRKAKRCPLTVRAAQLLAKGFTATGDPNGAADMMIARGWQGFKPEWFNNERSGNGQGRQTKGAIVDAGKRLTERLGAERRERELRAGNRGDDGDSPGRLLPGFGSK
jgi:uncharacterized protein YdaU (DUF1376 family)